MLSRLKPSRRVLCLSGIVFGLFVAWFVPWVFVLHLGVLFYFPYKPDGHTRYLRVIGPVAALFGADWTPRSEIPEAAFAAVVAAEDAKFHEHSGVDWESLKLSHKANQRSGKVKRGGSTITQQLVKNAFLSRKRSYVRKARELAGALLLDGIMAKESQLTWYLNVVEFGPRAYGIEHAARYYFKKGARELTPSECIELAAILPRPNRWNRSLLARQYTPFFRKRYRVIYDRIRILGLLDEGQMRLARTRVPFPVGTSSVTRESPLPELEEPPPELPDSVFAHDAAMADDGSLLRDKRPGAEGPGADSSSQATDADSGAAAPRMDEGP